MQRGVEPARRFGVAGLSTPAALFLAVLSSGIALRLGLAYVAYPNQGFASDLQQFTSWAEALARVGPGAFYASSNANYPPGYMYVLWLLGELGRLIGPPFGVSSAQATLSLLKLPPIAADAGISLLLYRAGQAWFGGRSGVVAAALYLFIPVTWYDSALWGQVDAVGAFLMLAAILALADGWTEPALLLSTASALVKPQDLIVFVVVLPVLLCRHVLRVGSGPVPRLGRRLAAFDARTGGRLTDQGPLRLGIALALSAIAALVVILPFDLGRFAPAGLSGTPVVGQAAGLAGLFESLSGEFSVLSANAFNGWALVGNPPLAAIAAGSGSWISDSLPVLGGLSAVQLGAVLLVGAGLLVAGGLLVRDDRISIVLGFAVVAFAFYALPTRVHERYLFPFFPAAALLAAPYLGGVVAFIGTGLMNTINIHAVLGAGGAIGGFGGLGGGFGGRGGNPGGFERRRPGRSL